jgi:hypothetical protein
VSPALGVRVFVDELTSAGIALWIHTAPRSTL